MPRTAPEVPDARHLERARTRRRRTIEAALRGCSPEQPRARRRLRARARAQHGRDRRPRVARRGREPARAGRPLPPVAHDHLRGRAGAHRRSTRGVAMTVDGDAERGRVWRSCASASRSTSARAPGSLDTIVDPLLVTRPADRRLVAARARRGGRRAARPGGRGADRLRRRSPTRAAAVGARRSWRAQPTWSTSRGFAARRGASGSPPPSTRPLAPGAGEITGDRPPPPGLLGTRLAARRLARLAARLAAGHLTEATTAPAAARRAGATT